MLVPRATYEVVYNGKNITDDILPFVIAFTYTDKCKGEADELELQMEDSAGLWRLDWYPVKGDTITARIFKGGQVLECGTFEVDEIEGSGSMEGDTFSIRALAAGIKKNFRTKNSFAHENKTLREIVNTVAAKHGLTIVGTIDDIRIGRKTQTHQSDLAFLQALSLEFGYTFSIRNNSLVFESIFELENRTAALTISRNEIGSYSIKDKTSNTYKSASISFHNAKEKKLITHEVAESNEAFSTAKSDTLKIQLRAENKQQAERMAKAALYRANSLQQEGSLEMEGNVFALAGNTCELVHVGMFSGKYFINQSAHSVSKDGGYTTSVDVKRVGLVQKQKQKA